MTNSEIQPDPASVFGAASSLWEACLCRARADLSIDLSAAYNGYDELMREVMRIGLCFEAWACQNIEFEAFDEVWPYKLQEEFGEACLGLFAPTDLSRLDFDDCLFIAIRLGLPLKSEIIRNLHRQFRCKQRPIVS